MTQTISAQDARNNFAEVLNTAVYGRTNVVITRFNKPKAVLIDFAEYERLVNPRLRYTKDEWNEGFVVFDKIRTRNKVLSQDKIMKKIDETVAATRKERRVAGGS